MQQLLKVLSDIFSMSFDIIIPLSGCIVAFVIALVLFFIRYSSFKRNMRRYERRQREENAASAVSHNAAASATTAAENAAPVSGAAAENAAFAAGEAAAADSVPANDAAINGTVINETASKPKQHSAPNPHNAAQGAASRPEASVEPDYPDQETPPSFDGLFADLFTDSAFFPHEDRTVSACPDVDKLFNNEMKAALNAIFSENSPNSRAGSAK